MSESGVPLVSVVMPTRNRAALMERALSSVVEQTFARWELLVVDDASTDATAAAVSRHCDGDSRIHLHELTEQVGGAAARNRGIEAARGEWIAFLDDDDEWLPRKLERQLDVVLDSPSGAGLVYCSAWFVTADGSEHVLQSSAAPAGATRRALLHRNFISTPTVMVRTDVVRQVGGFDETLPRLQDWDLWIRLAGLTPFAFLDQPLVRAFHTEGGISTRSDALLQACRALDQKYRNSDFDDQEIADFQHALGHILMIGGAPEYASPHLWQAVRRRPTVSGLIMAGLADLSPNIYRAVSRMHERFVRYRAAATERSGT
jgi:glycosyltransferase involved in cell wall biosynthesis